MRNEQNEHTANAIRFNPIDANPIDAKGFDVGALRRRMGLSQRHFAGIFGLSVGTLRHWERGSRRPTGTALVLLHVIAINPRAVRVAVLKARAARREVFSALERPQTSRAGPGFSVPV